MQVSSQQAVTSGNDWQVRTLWHVYLNGCGKAGRSERSRERTRIRRRGRERADHARQQGCAVAAHGEGHLGCRVTRVFGGGIKREPLPRSKRAHHKSCARVHKQRATATAAHRRLADSNCGDVDAHACGDRRCEADSTARVPGRLRNATEQHGARHQHAHHDHRSCGVGGSALPGKICSDCGRGSWRERGDSGHGDLRRHVNNGGGGRQWG